MPKPYQNFKPALGLQEKLLAKYQQQINIQKQLLIEIRSTLPENLRSHVDYAVWNQNKAIVFSHSSVFAAQLRFYAATIQIYLAGLKQFSQIEQVQIRITIAQTTKFTPREAKIPSGETIRFLNNSASRGNKDDLLQQALQNLSQTLAKRARQKD